MRSALRELVADLPEAIITATGMAVFMSCVIGILIVLATPIPEVMQ